MRNNKGISLIVLIVTIVVIIILAAVVILTITKNNPIESAKEARFKEDIRTFQYELSLAISKNMIAADKKITELDFEKIKEYISSFSEKYRDKIVIQDNELRYTNKINEKEKEWLKQLNIAKTKSLLPDGYTELEYIESTGTQYIDTALTLNGCNVEIKFRRSGETSQEQVLFGGRSSFVGLSQDFSVWTNESGDKIGFHYGKTDTGYMTCDFITAPVVLKNKGGNFYANDELLISIPEIEMSNSRSVFLFGLHTWGGGLDNRTFIGKIYYFKVWDKDNNLIMHLVPCYRISNNKVGMYDMVSDEFFTNEGTGEFLYKEKYR